MISFTLELITPLKAAMFLENNSHNRKLNEKQVSLLASDMVSGNWRLTHQAIAIDADGELIDGQHRLRAVLKSNAAVNMYVARYEGSESVMALPIDLHKKRSQVDILKCDHRYVEVVNTIFWVTCQRAATVAETAIAIERMEPHITTLHEMVAKRPKVRGSAGVRTGVLFRMLSNPMNSQVYAELYRDFCLLNFDGLNHSMHAFVKTCELSASEFTAGQNGRNALLARTVYAFDLKEQGRKIIRISKDCQHEIIEMVRQFFRNLLNDEIT